MNNNSKSQPVSDYLSNKLSAQESARLETWYLQNAEAAADQEIEINYPEVGNNIWTKINQNIELDQSAFKGKEKRSFIASLSTFTKLGIAASLLVMMSLAVILTKNSREDQDHFVVAKEKDIAPGKNIALLTLSNGRKIDLAQMVNGQMIKENGLEIIKTADGQLIYNVTADAKGHSGLNTVSTPAGGQYKIVLPDGSTVWLNASSSLTYPTKFASNERNVTLTGEGYFEIKHIEGKSGRLPFSVSVKKNNAEYESVQVLGTHFNINAYLDEPAIKTTLLQGSVRIEGVEGQTALMKPGQQAEVYKGKMQLRNADTEEAVAWKNGEFIFREDLQSAMRKIARWYDVEVFYDESAPKQLMLGGWMSRATNISEVLNHIQLTGKVHFKLEGRRITVSK